MAALDVPVLDAHIHQWDPRVTPRLVSPAVHLLGWSQRALHTLGPRLFPQPARDFVGDARTVMTPYLPGIWRHDHGEFEVSGFVHIEADWHTRDPLGYAEETHWLETICGSDLLAIVGHADLSHPRLDTLLDRHREASPRFVGIRDMLAFSADPNLLSFCKSPIRMNDDAWRAGYARLGQRGLTFDAWMYQPQLRDFERVVREIPETKVVLDHLGTPPGLGKTTGAERSRIVAEWHDDLSRLAQHPQVHVKLSGLLMPIVGWGLHERGDRRASVTEIVDRLGPHIAHALDVFGTKRCVFASNFPMDKVSTSWISLYSAFAQLTSGLDRDARRDLFDGNARRFYGIATRTVSSVAGSPDPKSGRASLRE